MSAHKTRGAWRNGEIHALSAEADARSEQHIRRIERRFAVSTRRISKPKRNK